MSPGESEGSEATATPEGETDFKAAEGAALGEPGAVTPDLTQGRIFTQEIRSWTVELKLICLKVWRAKIWKS